MSRFPSRDKRPNEAPMPDALAYLLTWTTYGTWLPGDHRGWVRRGKGFQMSDPVVEVRAERLRAEEPCLLNPSQRALVEQTIVEHCRIRNWHLHAVNCRTNHVHVVVTAPIAPEVVREQFKAWCTRRLREMDRLQSSASDKVLFCRENWWTERGSERYLEDEESLEAAVIYVREGQ